ncbi:Coronin-7 [Hondaea fermentalgiana]|uniref:Coronin n=1 Tax=Hondaea fermentalgiana TaxID=2315210 RepID=A0A2R5GDI9_9STRA|nr:Coronin-7 [Hondaea fermentalgiana]|eukprot:GBG29017.1 Coronin-7 [Hondaea fermentalgiana]
MSKFVRDSQLRNLAVDGYSADEKFAELQAGDVATHGNLLAASPRYLAFVGTSNGSSAICALDVNEPGKYHGLNQSSCQQGGIYDLAFAPHGVDLLASGAGNGSVALWRASGTGRDVTLDAATTLGATNGARAHAVRWHPSAEAVLAVGRNAPSLEIWDANAESEPLVTIETGGKVLDAAWSPTGSFVASLVDDKSIKLFDPRQQGSSPTAAVEKAHLGPRALGRIVNGGASGHNDLEHMLYSTGFSMTRDRELAVWDARKLDTCLSRQKVASGGTGVLIPVMSPDLRILFVIGKGETSVRAYEATSAKPFMHSLSQTTNSSEPFMGVAALPPAACDIMGCEVNRLFKLSSSSIEPIRVEVPRRKKSFFHEELFPDAADLGAAAMTASEWWSEGKAVAQPMVPVRDMRASLGLGRERVLDERSDFAAVGAILAAEEASREEEEEEAQKAAKQDAEQASKASTSYEATELDKRMSRQRGYVPKFKFAKGTQAKRERTVYNLTVGPQPALAVGARRFAVPWHGGGGPVFVGDLETALGKIEKPERVPVLNGHTRPVFCVDLSPTDPEDRMLATGSDDCHIRVWRLPEDVAADPSEASSEDLAAHQSSVRHTVFHPSVANILASGSQDATVRVWDVNKASCVRVAHTGDEMITSIAWNYPGSLLASMDRANALRVTDPRAPDQDASPLSTKAHAGAKPCFVTWLGDSPYILSSGCARMGFREFSVWDARKTGEAPLNTTKVGQGATALEPLLVEDNGVVILTGRGENTFHVYEIETLTRAVVKPEHCGSSPLKPHQCQEFLARGDPTTAVALAPRRVCDLGGAEWARVLRLTPNSLEPVSFTIPRASDLASYFADDIYPDARTGEAASTDTEAWLAGQNFDPVLSSLNTSGAKTFSSRDPEEAHASLKRAQANTHRFKQQKAEEDARQKAQDDVFKRMQFMAVQHEAYNPNLSSGKAAVPQAIARSLGVAVDEEHIDTGDVEDDEWDD